MPHICKRNKIYYVFWYENKKHHCKAISPSLKETEQWCANLTLRLYSKRNGMPVRFYPFKDFVEEYIKEYVRFKMPRTQHRDFTTINNLFRLFPNIEYVKDFNDLLLKQYISIFCLLVLNLKSRNPDNLFPSFRGACLNKFRLFCK